MHFLSHQFARFAPMAIALVLAFPRIAHVKSFSVQPRTSLRHFRKGPRGAVVRNQDDNDRPTMRELKVLVLHGSGGSGLKLELQLSPLQEIMRSKHSVDLQIIAPTAPYDKGDGYAWWTMADGVRSFNANKYIGFEASANMVCKTMKDNNLDFVLAHSQGAILLSALLGLNRITCHPSRGYILNGVAWPNPFGEEMQSFRVLHDTKCSAPRALFVMGDADRINPISSAQQTKTAFEQAGFQTSLCEHPGGHSVPIENDDVKKVIANWISL